MDKDTVMSTTNKVCDAPTCTRTVFTGDEATLWELTMFMPEPRMVLRTQFCSRRCVRAWLDSLSPRAR
jgi:hypothetical protein